MKQLARNIYTAKSNELQCDIYAAADMAAVESGHTINDTASIMLANRLILIEDRPLYSINKYIVMSLLNGLSVSELKAVLPESMNAIVWFAQCLTDLGLVIKERAIQVHIDLR